MNRAVRNVVRVAGIVVGVGAAVWAMRDKLLPQPAISDEPPPRFRTGSGPTAATAGDDLTEIKGIGPVYAGRLSDQGMASFAALSAADPTTVAIAAGVPESAAEEWIAQAKSRT